jgi:hypothetical protein
MLRALSVGAWLLAAGLASAQSAEAPAREPGSIQDNSFLVEEAYNQEPGVVQHIQQFTWVPSSGSWLQLPERPADRAGNQRADRSGP